MMWVRLSGTLVDMLSDLPRLGREVRFKLDRLLDMLKAAQDATEDGEEMISGTIAAQKVAIDQPRLLSLAAGALASFLSLSAAGLGLCIALALYVICFTKPVSWGVFPELSAIFRPFFGAAGGAIFGLIASDTLLAGMFPAADCPSLTTLAGCS